MRAQATAAETTTRHVASDEQGIGLRATWRPHFGFVNLSLWRSERCMETFHLTPVEAAKLVGFLVNSLASAAPDPRPVGVLRSLEPAGSSSVLRHRLTALAQRLRGEAADRLEEVAERLRP